VERLVSVYHKTNVPGLQSFLRDKFTSWANNGRGGNLETFKERVFESIDSFVPHKILRKNPDPDLKRLKAKVRIVYNKRKFVARYQVEHKTLKNCWQPKKRHRKHFCGQYYEMTATAGESYKYVKRRKGNRKSIPAIKDHSGTIITDSTEKANILNSYHSSVFCCDHCIPKKTISQLGWNLY